MAIMPILRNPHLLLVTLLLCNAAAVEVSRVAGHFVKVSKPLCHPVTSTDLEWITRGTAIDQGAFCLTVPPRTLQALPIFLDKLVPAVVAIVSAPNSITIPP